MCLGKESEFEEKYIPEHPAWSFATRWHSTSPVTSPQWPTEFEFVWLGKKLLIWRCHYLKAIASFLVIYIPLIFAQCA